MNGDSLGGGTGGGVFVLDDAVDAEDVVVESGARVAAQLKLDETLLEEGEADG